MNKKSSVYPQVINKMWITCLFCAYCLLFPVNKENNEKKSKKCLTLKDFFNIIEAMFYEQFKFLVQGGGLSHEDDIPTKKETEIKSSWFQKKNEHC